MTLRSEPGQAEGPLEYVEKDLLELIERATGSGESCLRAVADLKAMRLRQRMAHELVNLVQEGMHPAVRATAAQVLGYHGAARIFSEIQATLSSCVKEEPDLIAAKSITFALKDTDATWALMRDRRAPVAAEAVLGAPLADAGQEALLGCFFDGPEPEVEQLMLHRVQTGQVDAVRVVHFLFTANFPESRGDPTPRVERLFHALDPVFLFRALVEAGDDIQRTYQEIWPGIRRRERKRALLEIFEDILRENRVPEGLVREIVTRVGADERFSEKYRRFVQALIKQLDAAGATLVDQAEAIGPDAGRDGLSRLGDLLAVLVRWVPETGARIQAVTATWEPILPGVQIKAFHAGRGRT